MSYAERETLKAFARRGVELQNTLIMISHWMASAADVTFTGYASNWAAANTPDGSAMRAQWPLNGPRMIANNTSEWGSAIST